MIKDIYNDMLNHFSDTLEETSKDDDNQCFMTSSLKTVVNIDKLKEDFAKSMSLGESHDTKSA